MALKTVEALGQHFQGVEVVWREHLSLNDREVDLDLIEPTGMDGAVDHADVSVTTLQASDTPLASVSGTVVHDPKHPSSGTIGFLAHGLGHQAVKGIDTAGGLASAKELGCMYVQSGQVGPGA